MGDVNVSEIATKVLEGIQNECREMKKLNVMVLGKTGSGKSTLINSIFDRNVAETGIGRPITKEIHKLEVADFPLTIFDTPGLELNGENAIDVLLKEVIEQIKKGVNNGDLSEMVHCIWYCVSTASNRIENAEIDLLKKLSDNTKIYNVPVIIVLTKSYAEQDAMKLKKEIEKEKLNIVKVIPILAQDFVINGYTVPAYGLDTLASVMYQVLPREIQKTFISVQRANLALKREEAQKAVLVAVSEAIVCCAVPIPFAGNIGLWGVQTLMLAKISAVFGINLSKSTLRGIILAIFGVTGTNIIGQTIVANALRLIPGVGSATGSLISSATATYLTASLGETYIAIMTKIHGGRMQISDLQTSQGRTELQKIFEEKLRLKRNNKGEPIN